MESGFKPENVRAKDNTLLNLALGICFSGLFLMIVGAAAAFAAFAFGTKAFGADMSYLFAVSFYLGIVVLALVGATYSYGIAETEGPVPIRTSTVPIRFRRR